MTAADQAPDPARLDAVQVPQVVADWPMAPLSQPAPEVIMEASGFYWRRYGDILSMTPTTASNDPTLTPFAVYRYVGWEDHDGTFHADPHAEALAGQRVREERAAVVAWLRSWSQALHDGVSSPVIAHLAALIATDNMHPPIERGDHLDPS